MTEYYNYDNNYYHDSDFELGAPFGTQFQRGSDFGGECYKEPKCEFETKFGEEITEWGF
jgi:hypothetical protein